MGLPHLLINVPLVEKDGTGTLVFQKWWQKFATEVSSLISGLETQVNTVTSVEEAVTAANAAAEAANTAAANAALSTVSIDQAINNVTSHVSGLTLTGTDAGASASITVSAHTRVRGDGSSLAINGGSITGLGYSTKYYVYYNDPSVSGGTVTYLATTVPASAAQVGTRFLVGSVTTPAALGAPTTGVGVKPFRTVDV